MALPVKVPLIYFQHFVTFPVITLLIITVGSAITWYMKFRLRRKKLYQFARELPGPLSLPFIGSTLYFLRNTHGEQTIHADIFLKHDFYAFLDIFKSIMNLFETYPRIFKIWFGPKLLVCISEPKYVQILFRKCLKKNEFYKHFEAVSGNGLFSAPSKFLFR